MFEKLKSILKGTGGSKPPKQSIEPMTLSLHEIKDWLNQQEDACKMERNEVLLRSKEVIEELLVDIRKLVLSVHEVPTDNPLHPKVVQVNTQQLPLFKNKILSALDATLTFSDDAEKFYTEVGAIINAIFRAFRGPGKYLHQSYPQGMHELRDQVDSFGKEINVMTAAMKISKERLANIEAVHQAYDTYNNLVSQYTNVDAMKSTMETRLKVSQEELARAQDEKTAYLESEEYQSYDLQKGDLKHQSEIVDEEKKTLQMRLNTSVQVWKRAMHEWHALSDKRNGTAISKLIALVEENGVESNPDMIMADLKTVVKPLFQLMDTGKLSLKNAAERSYFSTSAEYLDELNKALVRYNQKKKEYEEAKRALTQERAPEILLEMQERVEKLQEEIDDIKTKISKNVRKKVTKEEVEERRNELLEKMTAYVNHGTENQIPVVISDLMDDDS
ncbi:MAG: hypothetical protein LBV40_03505 [Methanomicrobiales archaeon]|nr:hypothetical protein [Methanomicrobiales archaeon]